MERISSPGEGRRNKNEPRRWKAVHAGKEPYSGTSPATAISAKKDKEPVSWWDVIEHPEDHVKK